MHRAEKISRLELDDERQRRECEQSYYEFFKRAWREVEPAEFKDNWHIKYLCNRLQTEIERIAARQPKTKDLIIIIPPRSGKSYITSVMLCPWAWVRFPWLKFISSSYKNSERVLAGSDLFRPAKRSERSCKRLHRWGFQGESGISH